MCRRVTITAIFVLGGLFFVSQAYAQGQSDQSSKSQSISQRLDSFGKTLFGDLFPTNSSKATKRSLAGPSNKPQYSGKTPSPRAGGISKTQPRQQHTSKSSAVDRMSVGSLRTGQKVSPSGGNSSMRFATKPSPTTRSLQSHESRPLHQRLSRFGRSTFSDSPQSAVSSSSTKKETPNRSTSITSKPTIANALRTPQLQQSKRAIVARKAAVTPKTTKKPALAKGTPVSATVRSRTSKSNDRVLLSRQTPVLNVRTTGPRKIAIGREASFEITIDNSGSRRADDVVVFIDLPVWTEIIATEASVGATKSSSPGQNTQQLHWRVGRLDSRGSEKLTLRLIPHESRPINLSVNWDFTPAASQMVIEVQEPKLSVKLHGPQEILFGKNNVFKLELNNTGNGDAENLAVTLYPVGTTESEPTTHNLGTLEAGKRKIVEIELTARQTGTLAVNVEVRGDGNIHARASRKVLVRRAGLHVSTHSPRIQYVGTVGKYTLNVTNPGNAAANNVNVAATLPSGTKYISSQPKGVISPDRKKVVWSLADLAPGAKRTFTIQCHLTQPGANRLAVAANAKDNLTASSSALTMVQAMADLRLAVDDPSGPIAVGSDTVYKLRVKNRGSKSAQHIEIVTYFSRGIEPLSVSGAKHKIGPGQVVFNVIPSIPPGEEVVLTIKARADIPGNHMFRAEVYCKPLGTKLVSEDTTHFYNMSSVPEQSSETRIGNRQKPTHDDLRTVDRRQSVAPTHAARKPGQPTLAPPRGR